MPKIVSKYQHPLDWFLAESEFDDNTRLRVVARQYATEQFDADSFWRELKAKLEEFRYPQPSPREDKSTFYEILKSAGVLDVLSHRDTLRELWKCLLLEKIIARDRELETDRKASSGETLQFHKKEALQILDDLKAIDRIADKYDARSLTANFYKKVSRKFRRHVYLAMESRHTGSRAELLGGRSKKRLAVAPRSEELATQVAIYRTLRNRLQSTKVKKKRISDIFLCQLSELIAAVPNIKKLSNGENLQKAVKRSQK